MQEQAVTDREKYFSDADKKALVAKQSSIRTQLHSFNTKPPPQLKQHEDYRETMSIGSPLDPNYYNNSGISGPLSLTKSSTISHVRTK